MVREPQESANASFERAAGLDPGWVRLCQGVNPFRGYDQGALELSCGLPPGPHFADLAVLAEQVGYKRIWIFDSAPLWEDPFVHLALAAVRTRRIGLGTAVLVPSQRSIMAMASSIATIARLSDNRLRACFGTGYTARRAMGQTAMPLDTFFRYVSNVGQLLAGKTVIEEGQPLRMLHWPGLARDRPIPVPIWVSVFGPRGTARASEVAEGTLGPKHPNLPTGTMVSGTVLYPGESGRADRVKDAIGPWRVTGWHMAYAQGGASAVDTMPGGPQWRSALGALSTPGTRHLLTFEGHVSHLTPRDVPLLKYIDTTTMVGEAAEMRRGLTRLAHAGFAEVIYTPAGQDIARELRALAAAYRTS
jgi:5,10-methylenetetrahydromethanopterin reductase